MEIVPSVGERLEQENCSESWYFEHSDAWSRFQSFIARKNFSLRELFCSSAISNLREFFHKRASRHGEFSSAQVCGFLSLAMTTYKQLSIENKLLKRQNIPEIKRKAGSAFILNAEAQKVDLEFKFKVDSKVSFQLPCLYLKWLAIKKLVPEIRTTFKDNRSSPSCRSKSDKTTLELGRVLH